MSGAVNSEDPLSRKIDDAVLDFVKSSACEAAEAHRVSPPRERSVFPVLTLDPLLYNELHRILGIRHPLIYRNTWWDNHLMYGTVYGHVKIEAGVE